MIAPAMPKRIKRERSPGWRAPAGAVYVGRGSAWGNRHDSRQIGAEQAVFRFAIDVVMLAVHSPAEFEAWIAPLRGRDLMCWCKESKPCHADVLLNVANKPAWRRS